MNNEFNRYYYRETVQDSGVGDEKVIRQRSGSGVYAHVRVQIHAIKRGEGMVFAWNAGMSIPARFIPAVSEGILDAMNAGELAGLEVTDVHASVENGSYHEEDSTAEAFREAAEKAAREAIHQAQPTILEALSLVTITLPENFIGAAVAMVSANRGQIKTMTSDTASRTLVAKLPSHKVSDLIVELLRISDGAAKITSRPAGFDTTPEPPETAEQWVAR
ncbi:MAG: hypothetical protein WB780_16555 [Candidatus Acidiferrales bacterium]